MPHNTHTQLPSNIPGTLTDVLHAYYGDPAQAYSTLAYGRLLQGRWLYIPLLPITGYKPACALPKVLVWEGRRYEMVTVMYQSFEESEDGAVLLPHFTADLLLGGKTIFYDDLDGGVAAKKGKLACDKGGRNKAVFVAGAHADPAVCGLLYVVQESVEAH